MELCPETSGTVGLASRVWFVDLIFYSTGLLYSSKASDIFKHNVAILESLYQKMQQQSHKVI